MSVKPFSLSYSPCFGSRKAKSQKRRYSTAHLARYYRLFVTAMAKGKNIVNQEKVKWDSRGIWYKRWGDDLFTVIFYVC